LHYCRLTASSVQTTGSKLQISKLHPATPPPLLVHDLLHLPCDKLLQLLFNAAIRSKKRKYNTVHKAAYSLFRTGSESAHIKNKVLVNIQIYKII
jgi:hypothetical protein